MPRIFISYRRDDSAYVAGMLSQRHQSAFGTSSIYIDIDAIPLGIDFREHIQKAVQQCDVLLAIIGQRWLAVDPNNGKRRIDDPTDFVRIEIETAIKRDIPVVPILIDNAAMPSVTELPEPLTPLAFRNAAELRAGRDLDHHVELIIKGLQQLQPSTHISSTTAGFSNTTTDQLTGKLRFIRDKSLGGSLFAFSIELDGHPLGELHPGEILEYSVSTGLHQLKVGHRGALFDVNTKITITTGQTRAWDVSLSWAGAVKLTER